MRFEIKSIRNLKNKIIGILTEFYGKGCALGNKMKETFIELLINIFKKIVYFQLLFQHSE